MMLLNYNISLYYRFYSTDQIQTYWTHFFPSYKKSYWPQTFEWLVYDKSLNKNSSILFYKLKQMWVVIRILQKQLRSSLTRKTWSWRLCHVNMWLSTMPCNWRQEILRHSIRNREYCAIPWYCKLVLSCAKLTTTKSLDIAHVPL